MKFIHTVALAAVLSSIASPVFAQENVTLPAAPPLQPGEQDVGAAISPMKKNQWAPFTGVLLSPTALATVIVELQSIEDKVKIETNKVRAEEVAKCDHRVALATNKLTAERDIALTQVEARNKEISILNGIIKQQEDDRPNLPLWVGLGTGIGVLGGIGFTLLTVYVTNQITTN